jgi:hypothetical protein
MDDEGFEEDGIGEYQPMTEMPVTPQAVPMTPNMMMDLPPMTPTASLLESLIMNPLPLLAQSKRQRTNSSSEDLSRVSSGSFDLPGYADIDAIILEGLTTIATAVTRNNSGDEGQSVKDLKQSQSNSNTDNNGKVTTVANPGSGIVNDKSVEALLESKSKKYNIDSKKGEETASNLREKVPRDTTDAGKEISSTTSQASTVLTISQNKELKDTKTQQQDQQPKKATSMAPPPLPRPFINPSTSSGSPLRASSVSSSIAKHSPITTRPAISSSYSPGQSHKQPFAKKVLVAMSTAAGDFTLLTPAFPEKCTQQEREVKIARYLAKRSHRMWKKEIKYNCRKRFAESRPRVGGRFVPKISSGNLDDPYKFIRSEDKLNVVLQRNALPGSTLSAASESSVSSSSSSSSESSTSDDDESESDHINGKALKKWQKTRRPLIDWDRETFIYPKKQMSATGSGFDG